MSANPEARLRLLFVSADRFPPFRVDVKVLFGRELAGRGHRIDWLLQSEYACHRAYSTPWDGGTAWVGPTDLGESRRARLRKHLRALRHDLRMFTLVRRNRYDVVQVKDKFIAALLGWAAARLGGARFVYWLSFPFPEESLYRARTGSARYPMLYRVRGVLQGFLLYRVILPLADHVFVQSEQMQRDLAAHGTSPAKMTPVPMGVSADMLRASAAMARRPLAGRRVIGYLGTLERTRHIDFLVRVLARVLTREPDARLLLVGDGKEEEDRRVIEREAQRLGVADRVTITGMLPRERALERLMEADVCVSPFYPTPILASTSPTKLVEYMALGRPVVANDHPEQRLVVETSGAGHCVPWDEEAFADAIGALFDDPGAAARMGALGRTYAEANRAYPRIATAVEVQYWLVLCQRVTEPATDAGSTRPSADRIESGDAD